MQAKESNNIYQKLVKKIVKVAYGDAGIIDWLYVHLKAQADEEIKSLLQEYQRTAAAVHTIKHEAVPEHIIKSVKADVRKSDIREPITSKIAYGLFLIFGRKAIPATILGILIVVVISFSLLKEPAQIHKYSKAEIELAEQQLKQSLAIVGRAFQSAEKNLNEEVLNNQLNKNLNRGYYLVNNILTGG